ncbi:light-regulated signal transduction histidine kinase (bacteriophytochrome) [Paucimonas lemoignei]|uniref:histidine kinase n=1 Tax=Paucimonas lemoignei TaxID=29443 RepID=A0A4R3HVE3_PAULE|nr:ATP-binding protein [Paucimonas lemoignei]TCS36035.1 light-regulated signal transduction histidine kinase (bacteriophytochrome) [Paucimonas lemoignei]
MEIKQNHTDLLRSCESEPIHIPGAIQPFGVLLSLDWPSLQIRNASENCSKELGIAPSELIGKYFGELVVPDQLQSLQQYLKQEKLREQTPFNLTLCSPGRPARQDWELSAHRHRGSLIVELERGIPPVCDALTFHRKIRDAVQALQSTSNLQQLCEAAVQQVKAVTGFDRVMLYQFNEEWHGKVIAEACAPHMDAYLNHHFPASDIPAQARAVFLENWIRMIPDVDYEPAALYPGINPQNGAPLDLGRALLRSVSPVHLEYLRNMQVKATLTISLVDDGKLWGLIACHHASPRRIDADSRLAAKMIGQLVSSQLKLKESLEDLHYRAELREVHAQLIAYMEQEDDLVQGLVQYCPNMLDMAAATGAAAAIYHDSKWTIIGKTPSEQQIEQLVDWLVQHHGGESLFNTNRLSIHNPQAWAYKDIASGLIAVLIPKTERNYILWFRPEAATTVTWAGNPQKAVMQEGDQLTLHPRSSFHSWQEVMEGVAEPWKKVEIEAIEELRKSILALDLQREFRKEQLERSRAERIAQEKESLAQMVSHDLRTPLSVIEMTFQLLLHGAPRSAEMMQTLVQRGMRAAQAIEHLASDVLDMARVDAGELELQVKMADAGSLVHDAIDLVIPLAEKKSVQIEAVSDALGVQVPCDRARIGQVLGNLISNALKFTPAGGRITVSVAPEGDDLVFCVADTGVGIAPEHLSRIFKRFWQEDHAKSMGTGLGLSIAKGIVEKHGGRIWAQSVVGSGSQFFFSIPLQQSPRQSA